MLVSITGNFHQHVKNTSMHKYLLPAIILTLTACQQGTKQNQSADSTTGPAVITTTSSPLPWAKRFKGLLAGQHVTVFLQRSDSSDARGWYVYDAHGAPISLTPEYGRNPGDSIILMEGYGPEDHSLRGIVTSDGHFRGKWTGSKNNYDFDLTENNDSAIVFSLVTYKDSARLFPSNASSPAATTSTYLLWPTGGAGEASLTFLQQSFAPGLRTGESAATYLKKGSEAFLSKYKSNAKEVDSASMNNGPSWRWSAQSGTVVAWNQWPLLAIEEWVYDFTGGAHGNGGSNFSLYDLNRNKKLSMQDVFKGNYKPILTSALEKSYRKKYNVPAGQSLEEAGLFVKKIEPNKNFFLTSHGAVFSYTPYEIASYAAGQISLFLPWDDIRPVVQEAYLR